MRARWTVSAVVAAVLVLVLAGCAGGGGAAPVGPSSSSAPPSPPATVALAPADRATDVSPGAPARVTVTDGRIDRVAVTASDGTAVTGAVAGDGRSWVSTAPLAYGTTYTYVGSATGADGRPVPVAGSFATVDPSDTTDASINIPRADTVGIAAPIIVQFDGHVTDKAAAQRAMTVQTSIPTPGSWAWLPDTSQGSRAHWRPQNYWTPGTSVSVAANMLGVNLGDGSWGKENVTTQFAIGRSQIVRADVTSHQMVVVRDGKPVMTFDASYGLGSDPNRNTTNGIHVVSDKTPLKLMTNQAYGYVNLPEHWAVRISDNGEFIHANPETSGEQGSENVTHGCVNLSLSDAQAYYDTAIYGDPVEVTNSPVPMPRTDIYDWSIPWPQWQAMSAV